MTANTLIEKYSRMVNQLFQSLEREDRLYFTLILGTLALGMAHLLINTFVTKYSGMNYFPTQWLYLAPFALGLALYAIHVRDHSPHLAYVIKILAFYFLITLVVGIYDTGIQYAPFPRIDTLLVNADQHLNFNTVALIDWTSAHKFIKKCLGYSYDSLYLQLPLLLPFLAILKEKKSVNYFLVAIVISTIIGGMMYYFFPTGGPASVLHSRHFITEEHATYTKFFAVHHHIPLSHYKMGLMSAGGLIAFPSFHVVWAVLLSYLCINRKWLFYPVALLNLVMIASTLLLGWHYLIDVIAGVLLAWVSLYGAQLIDKYYLRKESLELNTSATLNLEVIS